MERTSSRKSPSTNQSLHLKAESEKKVSVRPEVVLEELRPLIISLSSRLSADIPDSGKDFVQDGIVAVLVAANRFDADKGALERYAARYVKGYLLHSRRWFKHRLIELAIGDFQQSDTQDCKVTWKQAEHEQAVEFDAVRRLEDVIDGARLLSLAKITLTPNELEVVNLIYFEDLKAKEVAEHMGISTPRVSQLHAAALRKLRQQVGISLN